MIIDKLENCSAYEPLHKDFKKVFDFLKGLNEDSPLGKTVLSENAWVTVAALNETPAREQMLFEAHRNYIDIQYVISGGESFGYAIRGAIPTAIEYNPESDCEFFSGEGHWVDLSSGYFCILYPQDLHLPTAEKLGPQRLIRAVAKIKI